MPTSPIFYDRLVARDPTFVGCSFSSRPSRPSRPSLPSLARLALLPVLALLAACAASPAPPPTPPPTLPPVTVQPTVLSQQTEGTPKELFARGEAALMKQQWKEAAD